MTEGMKLLRASGTQQPESGDFNFRTWLQAPSGKIYLVESTRWTMIPGFWSDHTQIYDTDESGYAWKQVYLWTRSPADHDGVVARMRSGELSESEIVEGR